MPPAATKLSLQPLSSGLSVTTKMHKEEKQCGKVNFDRETNKKYRDEKSLDRNHLITI